MKLLWIGAIIVAVSCSRQQGDVERLAETNTQVEVAETALQAGGDDTDVQPLPNMVAISPGTFTMGSPETELGRQEWEGPQTQVVLTKGFYMGQYEVTQAEYLAAMGTNPSFRKDDPNRPVGKVSWNDAMKYCKVLTSAERAGGRCPEGWSYRLPTEAEWEYACRAGTTTAYSFGDDPATLGEHAWYEGNRAKTVQPVGQKLSNAWGLYDMHGNIAEFCLDSYSENGGGGYDWRHGGSVGYSGGDVTDPLVTKGADRVYRGGHYEWSAEGARCAARYIINFHAGYSSIGFRVVLAPDRRAEP